MGPVTVSRRTSAFLILAVLLVVIGCNLGIYYNISDYLDDLPNSYVWWNFAYLEIITQIGISIIIILLKIVIV